MNIKFDEYEGGDSISLTPENMAEIAALLRLSTNVAAVPAEIYLYFSGDKPYAVVYLKKISKAKRRSSLFTKRLKY